MGETDVSLLLKKISNRNVYIYNPSPTLTRFSPNGHLWDPMFNCLNSRSFVSYYQHWKNHSSDDKNRNPPASRISSLGQARCEISHNGVSFSSKCGWLDSCCICVIVCLRSTKANEKWGMLIWLAAFRDANCGATV